MVMQLNASIIVPDLLIGGSHRAPCLNILNDTFNRPFGEKARDTGGLKINMG